MPEKFFLIIVFFYSVAILLDNYGTFRLIVKFKPNIIATNYVKRGQIDFAARGFLFFTPPLLGIFLINNEINILLNTFFWTAFFSFLITCTQGFWFYKKIKEKFKVKFLFNSLFLIFLGSLIYSIHLFVPFYLNIISFYFKEHALWIVQLSPGITSISTAFIVYYLDPQIANFIDSKLKKQNSSILLHLLLFRVVGRMNIFLLSLYLILR